MIKDLRLGIDKGSQDEKIKIAKNLLKDGVNIDKIVKYTGLSKEEIEKLK